MARFRLRKATGGSTLRGGDTLRSTGWAASGASLPTSRVHLDPALLRRGQPILSGHNSADQIYGFGGISEALNHGMAYRVRTIDSWWPADDNALLSDPASVGQQNGTLGSVFRFAKNVTRIRLECWAKNGTVKLQVVTGASLLSPGTTVGTSFARVTEEITLDDQTGYEGYWQIVYTRTGGQTFQLLGWEVTEIALRAFEIPA